MSETAIPLSLLIGGLVAMVWYAVVEDRRWNGRLRDDSQQPSAREGSERSP